MNFTNANIYNMHANMYITIKNSFDIVLNELIYPTISMLKTAVKIQIRGLFPFGMSVYFIYLYIMRGIVKIIAIKPTMKNMIPISSRLCACAVIAPIVIPTYTIQ